MRKIKTLLRRLEKSLSTRGFSGTVWLILKVLFSYPGKMASLVFRESSRKQQSHDSFDHQYVGMDTGGSIDLGSLRIDNPNWKFGIKYQAVKQKQFEAAMLGLDLDYSCYAFIDIGSGKGRALLMAAEAGFLDITGVELSEELHAVAKKNIQLFSAMKKSGKRIQSICQDALSFSLPEKPTVLFLYHPFVEEIMIKFLEKLSASLASNPRAVYLVYVNDIYADVVTEVGFTQLTSGETMGDSWSTYQACSQP